MIKDNANSHKSDYSTQVKEIPNTEGFKNCTIGSKCMAFLPERANMLFPQDKNVCLGEPAYCAYWWSCIGKGLLPKRLPVLFCTDDSSK